MCPPAWRLRFRSAYMQVRCGKRERGGEKNDDQDDERRRRRRRLDYIDSRARVRLAGRSSRCIRTHAAAQVVRPARPPFRSIKGVRCCPSNRPTCKVRCTGCFKSRASEVAAEWNRREEPRIERIDSADRCPIVGRFWGSYRGEINRMYIRSRDT